MTLRWPSLVALLCAVVSASPALAQDKLGRLFFTPERRALLERQRQSNIQETRSLEGANMSLDGVVMRSGGRSTHWINGRPQDERSSNSGVRIVATPRDPARARLTAGEEAPADLRVGESINRATREAKSGIEGGSIVVNRAPARPGTSPR